MSVTEDWAAQCNQDGIVEAALRVWVGNLNKVVGYPDTDLVWPDDWTEEQQHAMLIGMNAAIQAATAALRAENERLTTANETLTGNCQHWHTEANRLRAENERLEQAGAKLGEMNVGIETDNKLLRAENERLREVMNDVLTFSNDPAVIKMVRAELIKDAPQ